MGREGQKSGYVVHGWPPGVKRLKILEFGIFIEARFSQHPIDKYIKNQNHVSKIIYVYTIIQLLRSPLKTNNL